MNGKLSKTVALAALMAGTAGVAHATDGWYGQATVGYSFDGGLDMNTSVTPPPAPGFGGDTDFSDDWMGALSLGYGFMNGFRLEGELSFRSNDLEETPSIDGGGYARAWGAMANLIYDFNRDGTIQPYAGIGLGYAQVDAKAADFGPGGVSAFNDDDSAMAYQFLAGIGFALSEQLTLDLGYRYFAVPELEYEGSNFATATTALPIEADYDHHAAVVGLRWQFAAPAPPPPPPPPPMPPPPPPPPPVAVCPAADFVVYFEWDRSNLNQAALETIDAAVARARNCNLGAVTVTGHTDTSGSAQYNIGLSERRASVVRDALVARGMPAGGITSSARGETELARATRDGVREPLNRRTAVTISFR